MRKRKWFRLLFVMMLISFFIGSAVMARLTEPAAGMLNQAASDPHNDFRAAQTRHGSTGAHPLISAVSSKAPQSSADQSDPSTLMLVPGGQSIGVRLKTSGVLVVGHHLIDSGKGQVSPAEDADIRVGDLITRMNGKPTKHIEDVREQMRLAKTGKSLKLTIVRRNNRLEKELIPVQDQEARSNRLGLYVRDSASGIGTMTFYDPETSSYGALGHIISDRDTGQPIPIGGGEIVRSSVQSIDRGAKGKPGEKIAFFPEQSLSIGNVNKNTPFGIYGHLRKSYQNRSRKALPVARADEVREGEAQILTVLDGDKVQAFHIQIMNAVPQKNPATKGLVIKITDPRLLKETGGIIQGMSGSPIIQDGKIVGAVTHVFINDPTSGYGVHIEWMLQEAGLTKTGNDQKAAG